MRHYGMLAGVITNGYLLNVDRIHRLNDAVIGGIRRPEDAVAVGRRAIELGFTSTVTAVHDEHGQLRPLGVEERRVFGETQAMKKRGYARFNYFQKANRDGRKNDWRCRAGGRYLYICEDGLVHYCSQQRGIPATPLETYTREDIAREYLTEKSCAPHCTVSCVHQISYLDCWRDPQTLTAPGRTKALTQIQR